MNRNFNDELSTPIFIMHSLSNSLGGTGRDIHIPQKSYWPTYNITDNYQEGF